MHSHRHHAVGFVNFVVNGGDGDARRRRCRAQRDEPLAEVARGHKRATVGHAKTNTDFAVRGRVRQDREHRFATFGSGRPGAHRHGRQDDGIVVINNLKADAASAACAAAEVRAGVRVERGKRNGDAFTVAFINAVRHGNQAQRGARRCPCAAGEGDRRRTIQSAVGDTRRRGRRRRKRVVAAELGAAAEFEHDFEGFPSLQRPTKRYSQQCAAAVLVDVLASSGCQRHLRGIVVGDDLDRRVGGRFRKQVAVARDERRAERAVRLVDLITQDWQRHIDELGASGDCRGHIAKRVGCEEVALRRKRQGHLKVGCGRRRRAHAQRRVAAFGDAAHSGRDAHRRQDIVIGDGHRHIGGARDARIAADRVGDGDGFVVAIIVVDRSDGRRLRIAPVGRVEGERAGHRHGTCIAGARRHGDGRARIGAEPHFVAVVFAAFGQREFQRRDAHARCRGHVHCERRRRHARVVRVGGGDRMGDAGLADGDAGDDNLDGCIGISRAQGHAGTDRRSRVRAACRRQGHATCGRRGDGHRVARGFARRHAESSRFDEDRMTKVSDGDGNIRRCGGALIAGHRMRNRYCFANCIVVDLGRDRHGLRRAPVTRVEGQRSGNARRARIRRNRRDGHFGTRIGGEYHIVARVLAAFSDFDRRFGQQHGRYRGHRHRHSRRRDRRIVSVRRSDAVADARRAAADASHSDVLRRTPVGCREERRSAHGRDLFIAARGDNADRRADRRRAHEHDAVGFAVALVDVDRSRFDHHAAPEISHGDGRRRRTRHARIARNGVADADALVGHVAITHRRHGHGLRRAPVTGVEGERTRYRHRACIARTWRHRHDRARVGREHDRIAARCAAFGHSHRRASHNHRADDARIGDDDFAVANAAADRAAAERGRRQGAKADGDGLVGGIGIVRRAESQCRSARSARTAREGQGVGRRRKGDAGRRSERKGEILTARAAREAERDGQAFAGGERAAKRHGERGGRGRIAFGGSRVGHRQDDGGRIVVGDVHLVRACGRRHFVVAAGGHGHGHRAVRLVGAVADGRNGEVRRGGVRRNCHGIGAEIVRSDVAAVLRHIHRHGSISRLHWRGRHRECRRAAFGDARAASDADDRIRHTGVGDGDVTAAGGVDTAAEVGHGHRAQRHAHRVVDEVVVFQGGESEICDAVRARAASKGERARGSGEADAGCSGERHAKVVAGIAAGEDERHRDALACGERAAKRHGERGGGARIALGGSRVGHGQGHARGFVVGHGHLRRAARRGRAVAGTVHHGHHHRAIWLVNVVALGGDGEGLAAVVRREGDAGAAEVAGSDVAALLRDGKRHLKLGGRRRRRGDGERRRAAFGDAGTGGDADDGFGRAGIGDFDIAAAGAVHAAAQARRRQCAEA